MKWSRRFCEADLAGRQRNDSTEAGVSRVSDPENDRRLHRIFINDPGSHAEP